jgi:hypothetical protein
MADINKLAEELSQLTVLEAAELVKTLEEKWGVSAAAPVAVAAAGAAPAAAAEAAEEKTEFDVIIKDAVPRKSMSSKSSASSLTLASSMPRPWPKLLVPKSSPRLARKPPMTPSQAGSSRRCCRTCIVLSILPTELHCCKAGRNEEMKKPLNYQRFFDFDPLSNRSNRDNKPPTFG